jgi:hypothetical protein
LRDLGDFFDFFLETFTTDGDAVGLVVAGPFVVGAGVGDLVGDAVGLAVGPFVGAGVGLEVGALVGDTVGLAVGPFVGAGVGLEVGALVGDAVGLAVGPFVGAGVGLEVGALVGDAVGLAVGPFVGFDVGAGVSAATTLNVTIWLNSQWLPTSQANTTSPTSSLVKVYEDPVDVPTSMLPLSSHVPDGWMYTLWDPLQLKVMVSPTFAVCGWYVVILQLKSISSAHDTLKGSRSNAVKAVCKWYDV